MVRKSFDPNLVTIDLGPNYEWVAELRWPEGETRGGPAVLVIRPSNPDNYPRGGLSQTVLREVDFKYALGKRQSQLSHSERWNRIQAESTEVILERLDLTRSDQITPEYLALLSRAYVGLVNQGQPKPLERLAEVTGKSAAAIKNHLWQATRKGLLERSAGRAGGRVTEQAADLLEAPIGTTVRTGERCPQSGVWRSQDSPATTAPIAEGSTMPPRNGKAVDWRLAEYA
ncbi:hypothetical protein [Mycobacterium malmoense]|uniref:hypothetical protein n=1 Tax=Mycobacterium malmoense TaxID=1780 RepID=UPI0021002B12|nr:hypothetical protein [Mycobacterium malmoense]